MGAIANISTTLGTAVADDGTLTLAYPSGQTQATLDGSTGGKVMVGHDGPYLQGVADNVDIAFGASNITVTNRTTASWPVGTLITASFGQVDIDGTYNLTYPKQVQDAVTANETAVADHETRITALEAV